MKLELIEVTDIDGIDRKDYPDFCDAFIASAVWKDTGKNLTDDELDELNSKHSDFVYNQVIKWVF